MIPLALLRPLALLPLLACLPCCGGESPVRDEPPCPGAEPRVSLALTYPPGDYRVEVDQEMAMEMEGGGSGGGPLSGRTVGLRNERTAPQRHRTR